MSKRSITIVDEKQTDVT